MKPFSISFRLFRNVLLLAAAMIVLIGFLTYRSAEGEISEYYDSQLITGANVLRYLMNDELTGRAAARKLEFGDELLSAEDKQAFNAYADWRMFRVWRDGRLALSSDTGPVESGPPKAAGFRDTSLGQHVWRVYSLVDTRNGVTIEVGEQDRIRVELLRKVELNLVAPLFVLLPLGGLLLWLGIQAGLDALKELIGQLERRSAEDLSPLQPDRWPSDLRPLIGSINQLFDRLTRAFGREQRFTDQAAHQLRTPLAVIKLRAQTALREADPVERDLLISQIPEGVDRASALVSQLLMLSRLHSGQLTPSTIDLAAEAEVARREFAPLAERRGARLTCSGHGVVVVDAALTRVVMANLIENALIHGGEDVSISVAVSAGEGWGKIVVEDDGPGLSPDQRERAFQRFEQVSETAEGAGLGLSLVREAARRLNGAVALETAGNGRGLRAVFDFPSAQMVAPAG